MDVEQVQQYVNKKVLIILRNDFKFTTTIQPFSGTSFDIVDKFGQKATIDCELVSMIYEKEETDE